MIVNFVVPILDINLTGGMICILNYANGLVEKGHIVYITPMNYKNLPVCMDIKAQIIGTMNNSNNSNEFFDLQKFYLKKILRFIKILKTNDLNFNRSEIIKNLSFRIFNNQEAIIFNKTFNQLETVNLIPKCDINIATSWETVLPVLLSKQGKQFYFMQHFEPIFAMDQTNPVIGNLFALEALNTYKLPMRKIANSTWLKNKIKEEFNEDIPVVLNAIDLNVFKKITNLEKNKNKKIIISYGGRKAKWKGFLDAMEAMKLIFKEFKNVEWWVYGETLSPPTDEVPFIPKGNVYGLQLAELYSQADMILCPSWYESFPLYPLEAMACGTPVITTPYGTEDYAFHNVNALIINPQDTQSMITAIRSLLMDNNLCKRLSEEGIKITQKFTWNNSIANFEQVLMNKYV